MKKKATVILLVSSFAFLLAILIFFSMVGKIKPGTGDKVFGETEVELFNVYAEGEEILNYIDLAAELSLGKAKQKNGNLMDNFKIEFEKYLNEINSNFQIDPPIDIKMYTFLQKDKAVIGLYEGKVVIQRGEHKIKYSFFPNFRIEKGIYLDPEGVQVYSVEELKETETMPIAGLTNNLPEKSSGLEPITG